MTNPRAKIAYPTERNDVSQAAIVEPDYEKPGVAKLEWHPNVFKGIGKNPTKKETSRSIQLWGEEVIASRLESLMDGAFIFNRGDAAVRNRRGPEYKPPGDLDVSFEGRSGLFESHAYLPRIGAGRTWDQGLDLGQQSRYVHHSLRESGRPFYVVWIWWATDDLHPRVVGKPGVELLGPGPRILGKRVDLLGRPHASSMGRGAKDYWAFSDLWSLEKCVEDFRAWDGFPFQPSLLS